jgi:UDPglucose 6-dehydrogenase
MKEARKELGDAITYCDNIEAAVTDADAVVLMTEWNLYRGLDLRRLKSLMRGDVFVDLRNVYEKGLMQEHGFAYSCVGR